MWPNEGRRDRRAPRWDGLSDVACDSCLLAEIVRRRYTGGVEDRRDRIEQRARHAKRVIAMGWAGLLLLGIGMTVCALTVSVAEFRLAAGPDSEATYSFVVVNDEPRLVDFTVSICDWDEDADGVTRVTPAGTVARSCAAWIAMDVESLRLGPLEERLVEFTVRVPPGVSGTYWAGCVIRDGSSTGVASELLVRIFVDVPPTELRAAVVDVSVQGIAPLKVTARLANLGNTRLCDIQGLLAVEATTGDVVSCELVPFHLLPAHSQVVTAEAPWDLSASGTYLVRMVFDYGAQSLVAGQIVVRVP